MFATPYLVKDPVGTARRLAPLIGTARPTAAGGARGPQQGLRLPGAQDPGARRRAQIEQAEAAGHRRAGRHAPLLPAEDARRAGARAPWASTTKGLSGLEQQLDDKLHGSDGEQRIIARRARRRRSRSTRSDDHSGQDLRLTLDASIQDRAEQVLAGVGPDLQPQGRDGDRDGPQQRRHPARWPTGRAWTPTRSARRRRGRASTARSASPTSRARPSSRSPSPGRSRKASCGPTHRLRGRSADPGRRPHDHRGARHGRDAVACRDILARSSNVGAVKIGLRLGDTALRLVGAPLRLRRGSPSCRCRASRRGSCRAAKDYSGSSIGNLPIGQGLAVTPMQMVRAYAAIANGGMLRGAAAGARRRAAQRGHAA